MRRRISLLFKVLFSVLITMSFAYWFITQLWLAEKPKLVPAPKSLSALPSAPNWSSTDFFWVGNYSTDEIPFVVSVSNFAGIPHKIGELWSPECLRPGVICNFDDVYSFYIRGVDLKLFWSTYHLFHDPVKPDPSS